MPTSAIHDHKLICQVWLDLNVDGQALPCLLYAGPRGDESRRLLSSKARLVQNISAHTHFEAMTIYYQLMGWGTYTTNQAWDRQPYPLEWILEQERAGINGDGHL
jgi:hypothetical protein